MTKRFRSALLLGVEHNILRSPLSLSLVDGVRLEHVAMRRKAAADLQAHKASLRDAS